jgi:NIMA (never in mitosis gene a)-related kinase
VKSKLDGNLYLAKKIVLVTLTPKERNLAHTEALVLKDLRHPHIVSYKNSYIDNTQLVIVMEYCAGGDLSNCIRIHKEKNQPFSERLILNWFVQIVLALDFIHSKKILHRDIKSGNIFLTANGTVKIGDFGISRVLEGSNDAASTMVGTPVYMSPEVCQSRPYTYKSDIWSLGCLLHELCAFSVWISLLYQR